MSRSELGVAAGFVLAGGASRRMGRDKALLPDRHGNPMIVRTAAAVARTVGNCTVVAPCGRYQGLLWPLLADQYPGEGPLGGILTALGHGGADWNLIVAVDMPFLDDPFLQHLLASARQGGESVVPVHPDGGLEPLCAVYHAGASAKLQAFFDAGGRRVKDALQTIPFRTIPAPEQTLRNCNTPAQWEAVTQ